MRIITIIIAVIILYTVGWVFYAGVFSTVEIKEEDIGEYYLVYEEHIGNYGRVHKIIDRLYEQLATEERILAQSGFGIYYDDPQKVLQTELRSEAGCIISAADYEKLEALKKHYMLKTYPSGKSLVARFPFKNTLSITLGITKVYPKLNKYLKENNIKRQAIFEIYDQRNNELVYIMPVK